MIDLTWKRSHDVARLWSDATSLFWGGKEYGISVPWLGAETDRIISPITYAALTLDLGRRT